MMDYEYHRVLDLMSRPNHYFVFGSNVIGIHGSGAAKDAHMHYGAKWGKGEGQMGRSYAIPTKWTPNSRMELEEIALRILKFVEYAHRCLESNPEIRFVVTKIGCGSAGYTEEQIKPLFNLAPENCYLPEGWETYG